MQKVTITGFYQPGQAVHIQGRHATKLGILFTAGDDDTESLRVAVPDYEPFNISTNRLSLATKIAKSDHAQLSQLRQRLLGG